MSHAKHRFPSRLNHVSMDSRRRKHNHREEAFGALWEHENRRTRGVNFGRGILQDLMGQVGGSWPFVLRRWRTVITNRDAAIAATVIQWLGTNVGMGFLSEALKRCGYRIVRDERWFEEAHCSLCNGRDRWGFPGRGEPPKCGWCGTGCEIPGRKAA